MVNVFISTALTEVLIGDSDVNIAIDQASGRRRRSRSGRPRQKRNRSRCPNPINFHPCCVWRKSPMNCVGVRRRRSKERHVKSLGLEQPATKITSNKRPSDRMGNIACERTTPNACFHELARPSSRARLISYKPIPAKAPIRAKQKREDQMRRCDGKDRCERQGRRHLTHPTSPWLSPQTIRTWPSMSGLISPSGSKSSMTARSFPISQAWDAG